MSLLSGELDLACLLGNNESKIYHYKGARIPIDIINVLIQPRKTFEEIELLAEDIASKNLMNPLLVARFTQKNCQRYLDVINRLWGTTYKIEELVGVDERKEKVFYVLLAGERRLRACKYLQEVGCQHCQEKFGSGNCYKRHFGDNKVDVRLCIDIPPLEAIFRQASENIHMRVPAHEEAKFYFQLFRLVKEVDPKFPLTRFARKVGKSPDAVRQAIQFCLLPIEIQDFVNRGYISYGIACELARLKNINNIGEEELGYWALRAITGNFKVSEFKKLVTDFLRNHQSGQTSLIDIFSEEQRKELKKPQFRLIVERHIIMAIWSWIHYFSKVIDLFETGKLGKEDSPFSVGSPIKVFWKLIEMEKRVLSYLQDFLPRKKYEEAEKTLQETKILLSQFLE